jgi:hypothetical protein
MNTEKFNQVLNDRIFEIRAVLSSKAKEYATEDRLHNFKVAARRRNQTPERALMGMKEKHSVSIEDIIDNIDKGILPSKELLNEKIGDEINYLILLEALLLERVDGN